MYHKIKQFSRAEHCNTHVKILALSKMNAFADNKFNVTQNIKSVFG